MTKPLTTISQRVFHRKDHVVIKNNLSKTKQSDARAWIAKSFNEFCSYTALHGYGYLVKADMSLLERITWAIILLVALVCAGMLLYFSYQWSGDATKTVIESTHYATWNIAFPAVTICNINKISNRAAVRLAKKLQKPDNVTTEDLSKLFQLIIHFQGVGTAPDEDYKILDSILRANNLLINDVLIILAPKCEEVLQRCMWKGTQMRCDTLFQRINTTDGICCSFNNHAFPINNFPIKAQNTINDDPEKVTACGYQTGLSVLLKPFNNDYHTTLFSSYGFRVYVHDSYDFVDDNADSKFIASKTEQFLSVIPETTYSTKNVISLPFKDRKCAFSFEIKLNAFIRYSYTNCLAECRSTMFYQKCGCIPFNYPNNGSYPTCDLSQINCIQSNRKSIEIALPGTNSSKAIWSYTCNCWPDCELLRYSTDITGGTLNRKYSVNSLNFFKDVTLSDQNLLHVYFNDLISTRYRKDNSQTWLGTLAAFGGLLGLFLGFSFVTFYELIYFFTIRPIFNSLLKRRAAADNSQLQEK